MLIAFVLIAAVELLCFGPFILHRGFYADDWIFLDIMRRSGGFAGAARSLAAAGFWARPVEILHYPLFYALGPSHPVFGQAILLALKIAEGYLLFRFLDRCLRWRSLALCSAVLALAYPHRSATHLWFANSPQGVSLVLALLSLLLYEGWIRTRRIFTLVGGLACYLVAVLSYESAAFTPLILGAGLAARSHLSGMTARRVILSTGKELLPYAAVFIAAVLWMWAGASFFLGTDNPKPLQFSFRTAWDVYAGGFVGMSAGAFQLCARSVSPALRYFPAPFIFLWGAFVAAIVLGLKDDSEPAEGSGRESWIVALSMAFAAFLAGYAPYVFSRHPYASDVVGIMNRLNAIGAWSGGMALAVLLGVLGRGRPRLRLAGLALVLGAFAWTNAFTCLQWAMAWRIQGNILGKIAARAKALPPGVSIVLMGAPARIGGAPVFTEGWDFDYALKLATGRSDLSGKVAGSRMRFETGFVAETPGAAHWPRTEEWRYPYRGLYAYRYDRDALAKLNGPPGP